MAWEIAVILGVFFSMITFLIISYLIVIDEKWSNRDIGLYIVKNFLMYVGMLHIPLLFIVSYEMLNYLNITGTIMNLMSFGVKFSGSIIFGFFLFNSYFVYDQIKKVVSERDD